MSGRYLYCQNSDCGIYLNASGADDCWSCGWRAGKVHDFDPSGDEHPEDCLCPCCESEEEE